LHVFCIKNRCVFVSPSIVVEGAKQLMNLDLDNKTILISGGASGIGEAITRACLAEGAKVVIVSRTTPAVQSFMAEMAEKKAACALFATELADPGNCQAAIQFTIQTHGQVFGLVNNAGLNDSIGLENGTPEKFAKSLYENTTHYYSLAHYALPYLKQSKGAIVNIASKVAITGQGGTSGYAAAKAAQLGLTREWAVELLPYGIRVNAVLPAEVMTPLYRQWLQRFEEPQTVLHRIENRIPLGKRMTRASEIAAAVVFLLSPTQSGHTTGQQLSIDGGYVHLDRAVS
jgi:L-fucose dehydrogenase